MSVSEPYSLDVLLQEDDTCLVSWRAGEDYTDTDVQWSGGGSSGSLGAQTEGESADYYITELFTANTEYIVWATGYVNGESNYVETTVTRYVDTDTETLGLSDSTTDDFTKSDTATDTLSITDTDAVQWDISLSATDTITVTDNLTAIGALTEDADFQYYIGDFNGKVYAESPEYTSDDGTAITSYIVTKETDLAEQEEESLDAWKTIYFIRLWYVDKYLDTTVIVGVSTDGGTTWIEKSKSIGTGDGTMKSRDFWFQKTGQIFKFRVKNETTTDKFQWAALEVYYTISGDYFEI